MDVRGLEDVVGRAIRETGTGGAAVDDAGEHRVGDAQLERLVLSRNRPGEGGYLPIGEDEFDEIVPDDGAVVGAIDYHRPGARHQRPPAT